MKFNGSKFTKTLSLFEWTMRDLEDEKETRTEWNKSPHIYVQFHWYFRGPAAHNDWGFLNCKKPYTKKVVIVLWGGLVLGLVNFFQLT